MSRVWRTFKSYVFWTYDRGSFHYDVMVTLILVFIFVTPHFLDFKDKPSQRVQHPNTVEVIPNGANGFIYQADAAAVDAQDQDMVRANFLRLIKPIAGPVTIDRIEPVRDRIGRIVAYRAWVHK
ncbi:MAG TPA: hypothetical protein VN176_13845 [Verrucomicrobiae bacterium]|nr:hypothetical protein [Verrucomicrobiae bacterium]